jgi:hypothetical protein
MEKAKHFFSPALRADWGIWPIVQILLRPVKVRTLSLYNYTMINLKIVSEDILKLI